ncbi:uncharacterized protein [Haliotis cracherodii]|uniref:uncharacterized protein n=1 Tax=Haliotis cracherodii TaxID=6455 RepID=UPI0039E7D5F5
MLCTCVIASILVISQTTGDEVSALRSVFDQYYQWRLKDSPEKSTYLNVHDYDGKVDSVGLAEFDFTKAKVDEFLMSLGKIDYNSLPRQQRYNYAVLNDTLTTVSRGYQWRLYGALNPINFLEGNQVDPESLLKITRFETKLDFLNFISRIDGYPQQIRDEITLMTESARLGRTNNIYSMTKVPGQIDDLLKEDPTAFVYYKPFLSDLDKLSIPESEKSEMREKAKNASKNLIDAFRALKQFIINGYIPHARGSYGVGGLNQGGNYYTNCLRWHLTVDSSPGQVHQLGLTEVARISRKMKDIMMKQNFKGTISEYFTMLRRDPRFHFKTADEIIAKYKDILYNRLYPALPKVFKNIPQYKVKVTAMGNDGPPAQYMPGSSDGSRQAEFQANVFRPNETDSFIMVGDALHEGVPGHHLQFIYQQTSNLPDFRKEDLSGAFYSIPFSYPGYSSYVEGWALYAESLGEELGLYEDDYELMGRYSNEIFRAGRLVVDTGLHFMGWTRTRAISYMQEYNALSGGNLENEIDRYITWPGQACAYKIGELKIRALREKAASALASKFDIRDFHGVVLSAGAVPLRLLETMINDWIADVLASGTSQTSNAASGHSLTSTPPGGGTLTSGVHTKSDSPATTKTPTPTPPRKTVYTFTGQLPVLPNIG